MTLLAQTLHKIPDVRNQRTMSSHQHLVTLLFGYASLWLCKYAFLEGFIRSLAETAPAIDEGPHVKWQLACCQWTLALRYRG